MFKVSPAPRISFVFLEIKLMRPSIALAL